MEKLPDLNLLYVFATVAETASVTAAARKLGIPKSSASRALTALERSLHVQLFHRTTRKVSLTTGGAALLERTGPLLAGLREALATMPEQDEQPSGRLRLTAPVDLALTYLPELAARFAARYPDVDLDVRISNKREDLVAEGYDAALRVAMKLSDSSLIARKLSPLDIRLYASPSYLARRGPIRTTDELRSHDWVLFSPARSFPAVKAPERVRLATDDFFFAREALRAGAGVGVLPSFLAQRDLVAGELVRVLPSWSVPTGNLFFVYPQTHHVPKKVQAFRDFLLEYLAVKPLAPP